MSRPTKRSYKRPYKYYEILSVNRKASQQEIRQAYRKLAHELHPDVNPSPDANEKFILINKAYEVLSDPSCRTEYDSSSAECPLCYTHEVIQTVDSVYRCRHCGCRFDVFQTVEIIEIESALIPEKRKETIRLFQTTQCSWCRRFYTNEPFLCVPGKLQSSCFHLDRLTEEERKNLLGEEKWWWRMADMLQAVEEKGIMAKCRLCFALNPNPQKLTCWSCNGDGLRCPSCDAKPFLRYSTISSRWKCPNTYCNRSFIYTTKQSDTRYSVSTEICPKCGKNLYWDEGLLLWRCLNKECKRIFTYEELNKKPQYQNSEKEQVKERIKSRRATKRLIVTIAILASVTFIILVWLLLGSQIMEFFNT
jgi:hypothetical protein